MRTLRVLLFPVGLPPEVRSVPDTFAAIDALTGGPSECVQIGPRLIAYFSAGTPNVWPELALNSVFPETQELAARGIPGRVVVMLQSVTNPWAHVDLTDGEIEWIKRTCHRAPSKEAA